MSKPILPRRCFIDYAAQQLRATDPALFPHDYRRIERAVQLIRLGHVSQGADLLSYQVRSATNVARTYLVTYNGRGRSCTCPDYPKSGCCKHVIAVLLVVKASNLEWILERARHYYQTIADRNALAAKAWAGTASERERAHLAFLSQGIEPLGRARFEQYCKVLDMAGMCNWRRYILQGGGA